MKPLHIFRAGQHTASCGTTLTFDEHALQCAVDAYDPKLHKAPIADGHPKSNGPAFGWIRGPSFDTSDLSAERLIDHALGVLFDPLPWEAAIF